MISHEKKIVFVHIPKTGGKTFSKFLEPYCDEESLKKFSPFHRAGHLHASWGEYVDYYGDAIKNYTLVSIVRNPWDKAVSLACHQSTLSFKEAGISIPDDWKATENWKKKFNSVITIPEKMHLWPHSHFNFWIGHTEYLENKARNFRYLRWPAVQNTQQWQATLNVLRYPNKILYFENYTHDVSKFFEHHNIKFDRADVERKTNTSLHKHYSYYYDDAKHIQTISDVCGLDNQAFQYHFHEKGEQK